MLDDGAVTWQRALCAGTRRDELGGQLGADVDPQRAALDEAAALRRIDRGRGKPFADGDRRAVGDRRIGHRGEQQARVRVQRVLQHLLDRALLDDLAGVHDEHGVGDVAGAREVVRDVEEREPLALLQVEHQVEDPDPDRDVEHRDRLVGDDHRGLDRERARDRDALALPARQLVRVLRRVVRGRDEADRLEQLVDALVDVSAR